MDWNLDPCKPVQCGGFADITHWPLILRRYYEVCDESWHTYHIPTSLDSSSLCFLIHNSMPRQAGNHLPILCIENSRGHGQQTAGSGTNLEHTVVLSSSCANAHHEFLCSWHVKHDSNILVLNYHPITGPGKKKRRKEKKKSWLPVDVTKE